MEKSETLNEVVLGVVSPWEPDPFVFCSSNVPVRLARADVNIDEFLSRVNAGNGGPKSGQGVNEDTHWKRKRTGKIMVRYTLDIVTENTTYDALIRQYHYCRMGLDIYFLQLGSEMEHPQTLKLSRPQHRDDRIGDATKA